MTTGWELLAVFEGGSVADLAAAQAADGTWHVFAATAVGVFRSVDRGRTWAPLGAAIAGAEVVVPSPLFAADQTLYIGAQSGLYRWQDGAVQPVHLLSGGPVQAVAVLPAEDGAVTVLVGTGEDGILVSRNGGRSWRGANAGLSDLTVLGLTVSAPFDDRGIGFAATVSGLYRTRNGGEAWRAVDLDLGADEIVVQCVALSPTFLEDRIVLAGTEDFGLLRSEDAGRTWTRPPALADLCVNKLTYLEAGFVVAATATGLMLSDDDGLTWRQAGAHLGGVAAGTAILSDETILLAALPETGAPIEPGWPCTGVARSTDGGTTWASAISGLTAHLVVGLALSPGFRQDQTAYIASLEAGVLRSRDAGRTWTDQGGSLPELAVAQVAVCPSSASQWQVFAATDLSLYTAQDAPSTGSASDAPGDPPADLDWQLAWTDVPPLPVRALAWADRGTTLVAAQSDGGIRISSDRGTSWSTQPMPSGTDDIVGLAVSPGGHRNTTLLIATLGKASSGILTVWLSLDCGRRWQPWYDEHGIPAGIAVPMVVLPANPWGDTVVLAILDRVLRPRPNAWEVKEGIRRPAWDATPLADAEQTGWTVAIAGLAASPDYARDRTLFAATSAGVYVSRDGGASFSRWSECLEPSAVVAVAVSPTYAQDRLVYALGLGGSVWRRTDG